MIRKRLFDLITKEFLCFVVFFIAVFISISAGRFGYVYPDSQQYILFVDVLRGLEDYSILRPPFNTRVGLPFLAFMIIFVVNIGNTTFWLSFLSMLFTGFTYVVLFNILLKYNYNLFNAFIMTVVGILSLPVLFYSAVPLVDSAAMFFILLVIYFEVTNKNSLIIGSTLLLGVLFKEIVIFAGLYYILGINRLDGIKTNLTKLLAISPAGFLVLIIKFFNKNTLIFNLTILDRPFNVFISFATTLGLVLLIMLYFIIFKREIVLDSKAIDIFKRGAISFLPLMILGLFFAYFDARFLWALLFIFIMVENKWMSNNKLIP